MDRDTLKLHAECHTCTQLPRETCKGKVSRQPCLGYKDKDEYAKEVLDGIKASLKAK